MTDSTSAAPPANHEGAAFDCLAGGGEMGALMRAMDWSATPLGPVEGWPQSLRSAVSICLGSRFPILLWWGPQLVMLYNDAYRPILGTTKHPQALGQTGRACWPEIWHIIGPMLEETVMAQGQATWSDDQLLLLDRNNYLEECYFTFSYSPIHDESGGVGGVFCAVTEMTGRVIGERRLTTLRELAAHASDARSAEQASRMSVDTLANNPADIPFALLYLLDGSGQELTLAGAAGLAPGTPASPDQVRLGTSAEEIQQWPWAEVLHSGESALVTDLVERFGSLPGGIWSAPPQAALIMPITTPTEARPIGLLVAGISPRRAWDDEYRGFFDLVAGHVATAIIHARAYEAERQRAEALAELDRAKTAFFSNVSHEFRTPLTLMLSPLEEMLRQENGTLATDDRAQLEMVHRNGLRLLKLVNTLLDFSRIEARRLQATYTPVDLGTFTAELASVFRSAIEHAGLQLRVDCPPLPQPVYVDQEMWEKIVLNLLSNAYKFTFGGEIAVVLRWCGDHVELDVRDTGAGIPADELPNLFTRFHRIRGTQARTHEGSGIGLALVQELVGLHEGRIDVSSTVGQGTLFTVTIPTGSAHLPPERIVPQPAPVMPVANGRLYVEEARRWLPPDNFGLEILDFGTGDAARIDDGVEDPKSKIQDQKSARILLVDDNPDLRDYLARVLAQSYQVLPVADGRAALEAAQTEAPDLVLADVMMPGLDGFDLLRALRANPQTATVPVILLSARAGEEARIEGLEVGADDYLVKPFSTPELVARIRTQLEMARLRRAANEREHALQADVEAAHATLAKVLVGINDHIALYDQEWRYVYVNDAAAAMLGMPKEALIGQCIWELFPAAVGNSYYQALHQALAEQRNLVLEHCYEPWGRWFENRIYAAPDGVTVFATDITEQKQNEQALRESEARFRSIFDSNMVGIGLWHGDGSVDEANDALLQLLGYSRADLAAGRILWKELTPPEYLPLEQRALEESRTRGMCTPYEKEYLRKDGSRVPVIVGGAFFEDGDHRGVFFALDISERKDAEEALRASEEKYRTLFDSIDEGFCIIEMIFDEDENPVDYRFVQMNASFSQLTGLEDAEGKTARELVPDLEAFWFETYGNVALTGEAVRFENKSEPMERWFDVYATRLGDTNSRRVALVFRNITERKQAEAALRASEERFSKAFHASPQPMSITRFEDGAYIDVNDSFAQMLGYPRAEVLGLTSLDTGLWQEPQARLAANELLRAQGGHRDYEHRFCNRNGEWRELQAAAELIELEGQLCILNVAIDITARKQAEAALVRAREQAEQSADQIARLQQVTAAIAGAATSTQLADVVIQQGAPAVGATAGLLVELLADGQRLRVIAAYGYPPEAIETEPAPLSAPTPISDCIRTGEALWLRSHEEYADQYPALAERRRGFGNEATAVLPLSVGDQVLGALAFSFVDVRTFDRAERELLLAVAQQGAQALERAHLYEAQQLARAAAERSATRIARLQTITADLAVALTPAQVVDVILRQGSVALDAVVMSVKLLSPDGLWLEEVDWVGAAPPGLRDPYRRYPISAATPVAEAVRSGQPVWLKSRQLLLDHYPNLTEEMTALGVESACALPLAMGARTLGGIGINFARPVAFDSDQQEFLLTVARQCAQALERARLYEVEQQARVELEARVQERTAELERSNRELDQFAYVASHDLKSPLRGIEHLANFLQQDVGTTLPKASQRHLNLIQSRIKRMEALLDDLLTYSRAGRHRYTPEELDLAAIIADVVELLAPPPGFVVEVAEPLPVIVGERAPVELIFRNLIGNAVKHHHRPAEGIVRIRAHEQDGWIKVSVADNGPGIDPAFHERIFEMFHTLKPRDQVEGSGIGLTVVKKMVETRGGAIWLESTPGEGTTFHFTWPKDHTD